MCSFIPHLSSSPKGLTIFCTKFLATPFHAQMTSKLLNMGLVACLRGHRASDALSLLRRAERGGPQLQLDFKNTGEQGEHGIQTWVFSIQQLVVFVLTLGACGQQPVRRVFETHWGILCFYLFSTEGERF